MPFCTSCGTATVDGQPSCSQGHPQPVSGAGPSRPNWLDTVHPDSAVPSGQVAPPPGPPSAPVSQPPPPVVPVAHVPTPEPSATPSGAGADIASIGWRAASWAIDFGVVLVAVAITSFIHPIIGGLALAIGAPAYYVVLVGRVGYGTLGHRAVGLRVIDDRTGEPADEIRSALRIATGLGLLIPFAIPAGISIWNAGTTTQPRTWHDMFSQTTVHRSR